MLTWLLWTAVILTQSPGFVYVASVGELMQTLIIPSSNVVFNVGLEVPSTEEEWREIENNAIVLAESGNLLMLPDRAQGREGWIEAAERMAEAGRRSLNAARSRSADTDLWFDLSDEILQTCSSCHDQYWIVN